MVRHYISVNPTSIFFPKGIAKLLEIIYKECFSMYVTRPLSLYKNDPDAVNEPPPRGPGSSYLVVQDEEYEAHARCCFGLCKDPYLQDLPFPQDRRLTVESSTGSGEHLDIHVDPVYFLPVIDLPLACNRYYVIIGEGKHQGKVSTSSTEADMVTCCLCQCAKDLQPKQFDSKNEYQQVEIVACTGCCSEGIFFAKSVVDDGFPQLFLRKKGWAITASTRHFQALGDALGIDDLLRSRKPDMNFHGTFSLPLIVGKWYCPFIFVREEELTLKEQFKTNLFYEMSLEQFWEEIYECEEHASGANSVKVCATIKSEQQMLHLRGEEVEVRPGHLNDDGFVWFRSGKSTDGGVGLDGVITKRMRWEVEREGWIAGEHKVEKEEEYGVEKEVYYFRKFKCYVLVERFSLKRMDGTLILTCDFRYANEVRSKWE